MTKSSRVLTSKKALLWVFAVAALLVGLILLRSFLSQSPNLSSTEGRQQYLSRLGWEIDPASEAYKRVRIPQTLEGVLAEYNEMQKICCHELPGQQPDRTGDALCAGAPPHRRGCPQHGFGWLHAQSQAGAKQAGIVSVPYNGRKTPMDKTIRQSLFPLPDGYYFMLTELCSLLCSGPTLISDKGLSHASASQAAITASMAALRNPLSSKARTPWMVVPPGEHTLSFRFAGSSPISSSQRAEPRSICAAIS